MCHVVPYLSWSWDSVVPLLGCTWGGPCRRRPVFDKLKWTLEHPSVEELRRLWDLQAEWVCRHIGHQIDSKITLVGILFAFCLQILRNLNSWEKLLYHYLWVVWWSFIIWQSYWKRKSCIIIHIKKCCDNVLLQMSVVPINYPKSLYSGDFWKYSIFRGEIISVSSWKEF